MAKGMYIGIDNKAKEVKKIYIGINNVAKKVIKGYIGVNGVARPFFSSEKKLSYYGQTTNLTGTKRAYLAAASVGNYALFGGGDKSMSTVDSYDKNLVKGTAPSLGISRTRLAAAANNNYAIFGGGWDGEQTESAATRAYDKNLTQSTPGNLSASAGELAATSINNCILFAGGYYSETSTYYRSAVTSYDSALTKKSLTSLSQGRGALSGAANEHYALFAGGYSSGTGTTGNSTVVDSYDKNFVKGTAANLTAAVNRPGATGVKNHILFAGTKTINFTDAYDKNLVKISLDPFKTSADTKNEWGAATTVNNIAFFAGGGDYSYGSSNTACAYDDNLVRIEMTNLSNPREYHAATSIGNYALFGGGQYTASHDNNWVDVYQVLD